MILVPIIIFTLLMSNGFNNNMAHNIINTLYKKGYVINFIEYDKNYEIDIDNDKVMDLVKVYVDEDRYTRLVLNGEEKTVGYSAQWVDSVLINDDKGNYYIYIAENGDNDIMGSHLYELRKEGIVYKDGLSGHISSAYKNSGLYVDDIYYIIGFQSTTRIYYINPDFTLTSSNKKYTIAASEHTLIKELPAYRYNEEKGEYEKSVYKVSEVLYPYETDMKHFIYFKTKDGNKGYIYVTKPKEDYEFYVGDEKLTDYFDPDEISWAG